MPYVVYLVKCRSRKTKKISFYTGFSNNAKRRSREHATGRRGAKYVKGKEFIEFRVIKLFKKRGDAMRYELKVKKLSSNKKKELFNTSTYYRYIPLKK